MTDIVTADTLHRTAKYFMDTGRAATHAQAMGILQEFGLRIEAGPEVEISRDHQIALLTLVNAARRTFLGGVHVTGASRAPLLVPLADAESVECAVQALGGQTGRHPRSDWPVALIGSTDFTSSDAPCWRLTWDGWRGGVLPTRHYPIRLAEQSCGGLAPALAAAACASEAFTFYSGTHAMAGRRGAGLSLWRPGADWLSPDDSEAALAFLPSRIWLIGLGNLGQAYLWMLAALPYRDPRDVDLVLQDYDRVAQSNDSTSVLTQQQMIGRRKTRAVAEWLERRGFNTILEERRFSQFTHRSPQEPAVALCGVDNSHARAALEEADFELVVESGLGAGTSSFKNFSLHTFPSSLSAAKLWSTESGALVPDVRSMPAYDPSMHSHLDECGLAQLASRTVGIPFVALTAAALAIAELLRRLHGGPALELISGSMSALEDIEISSATCGPYEFGHCPIADSINRHTAHQAVVPA